MSGGRRSQGAADGMVGVLAYQHAHASLTGQRGSGRGRIWSGSARSTIHILLMPPPASRRKDVGLPRRTRGKSSFGSCRFFFFFFFFCARRARTCRFFGNFATQLGQSFALAQLESREFFRRHAGISSTAGDVRRVRAFCFFAFLLLSSLAKEERVRRCVALASV